MRGGGEWGIRLELDQSFSGGPRIPGPTRERHPNPLQPQTHTPSHFIPNPIPGQSQPQPSPSQPNQLTPQTHTQRHLHPDPPRPQPPISSHRIPTLPPTPPPPQPNPNQAHPNLAKPHPAHTQPPLHPKPGQLAGEERVIGNFVWGRGANFLKTQAQEDKEQRTFLVTTLKATEHVHMNSFFEKSAEKKMTRADWQAEGPPDTPFRYAEIDVILTNKRIRNIVTWKVTQRQTSRATTFQQKPD